MSSATSTPARAAPLRSGTYKGIQALRFLAALMVVVTHSTFYARERMDPNAYFWGDGATGVHIFFVISGFVMIASSRSLEGTQDGWKYFAMRRLVRIAPMYWIATTIKLVTMLILPAAVLHAAPDPGKIALSYLFLPSRNVDGAVEPLLGVGWTLMFEMFFYALFAFALLVRARPLLFCGSVLILFAAANLFRPAEWPVWAVYFDPIVLYFLIGMLLAKMAFSEKARKYMPHVLALLVAGMLVIILHPDIDATRETASPFRLLIVTAVVLAALWLEPFVAAMLPQWLMFLGTASYSLYLFHPLVAPIIPEVLKRIGLANWPLSVILSIVASLVAAAIIYRFVERPLTEKLQKKLPYNRKRSPLAATLEVDSKR